MLPEFLLKPLTDINAVDEVIIKAIIPSFHLPQYALPEPGIMAENSAANAG